MIAARQADEGLEARGVDDAHMAAGGAERGPEAKRRGAQRSEPVVQHVDSDAGLRALDERLSKAPADDIVVHDVHLEVDRALRPVDGGEPCRIVAVGIDEDLDVVAASERSPALRSSSEAIRKAYAPFLALGCAWRYTSSRCATVDVGVALRRAEPRVARASPGCPAGRRRARAGASRTSAGARAARCRTARCTWRRTCARAGEHCAGRAVRRDSSRTAGCSVLLALLARLPARPARPACHARPSIASRSSTYARMASAALWLIGTSRSLRPLPSTRTIRRIQVQIVEIEADQLAQAQARGVEQLEDGLVAAPERRRRSPASRAAGSSRRWTGAPESSARAWAWPRARPDPDRRGLRDAASARTCGSRRAFARRSRARRRR